MPSPYIRIIESDKSTYTTTTSNTVVALVGFATKGPVDTPTLCTSIDSFKNTFGLTPSSQPYSHLAAYKYFDQGSSLWFTRIADSGATEAYVDVYSNDGTGVAAKMTSTNTATAAAFSASTDYKVDITVEIAEVEYEDTITINLSVPTDINEIVFQLNTEIAASSDLAGLLTAVATKSDGYVSSTPADNIYLTFTSTATGMDDAITLEDPSSGNSLLTNGSVGFAYSSYTAWGSYTSPTYATLNSTVTYGTDGLTTKNLSANYNLNIFIDDDAASTTVDLASKAIAKLTCDTVYTDTSSTTTDGFNPARYAIDITSDIGAIADVDVTGNLGASATRGYQPWAFTNVMNASSSTGLRNYGKAGFGNATLGTWSTATLHGLLNAGSPYEFSLAVEDVNLGGGAGVAAAVVFAAATGETIADIITTISGAIDALGAGVIVGKYSLGISGGNLVFQLTHSSVAGKNATITATGAGGTNIFTYVGGIFNGLTPEMYEAHYTIQAVINGGAPVNADIDGADGDLTTVSGLVSVLNSKVTASDGVCAFIAPNTTNTATGVAGGTYGKIIFYTTTKGTEPSVGVTQSSVVLADIADVPGTSLNLRGELTNAGAYGTGVDGLDVVLTRAQVVKNINTAIAGYGTAAFDSSDYLTLSTVTLGRTGTIAIAAGTGSIDALAFFDSAGTSAAGGAATTLAQMISAINTTVNTARSTSSVVYASTYVDTSTGQYKIKLQSEITGTDAKLYINSTNGTTQNDAPANSARATAWCAAGWATTTDVDTGDYGTVNSLFRFKFQEVGTAADYDSTTGNGCYLTFATRSNPLYTGPGDTTNQKYYNDISVYFNGTEVEKFEDVSYDRTATADSTTGALGWFMSAINADSSNGGSEYITIEWYDEDGTAWVTEPTSGTYLIPTGNQTMDSGDDGIPTGSVDSLVQAGITTFANPELYDPHILATPGVSSSSVINAAKNFIEGTTRQDILYLVDPPFGLDYQEIADWHNGKLSGTGYPTSAINSSYLALYWSWLKTYDVDNEEYIWCPPSVFMMAKLAEIDNNYKPWGIPAGITRGKITADDYEYSPSQTERDVMYDINGNLNVNPFVNFPGTGLIIWGQKTLLRENSALNRVAVRRTVIYVKKLARIALKAFMFEPNTPTTWARVTTSMSNILEPIKQGGGLVDYEVVFDSTTTTPSLQDQHILSGVIKMTPPSAIEAIEVTFEITAQGVTLA